MDGRRRGGGAGPLGPGHAAQVRPQIGPAREEAALLRIRLGGPAAARRGRRVGARRSGREGLPRRGGEAAAGRGVAEERHVLELLGSELNRDAMMKREAPVDESKRGGSELTRVD